MRSKLALGVRIRRVKSRKAPIDTSDSEPQQRQTVRPRSTSLMPSVLCKAWPRSEVNHSGSDLDTSTVKARTTSIIYRPVRTAWGIDLARWTVGPFPIPATPMIPSPGPRQLWWSSILSVHVCHHERKVSRVLTTNIPLSGEDSRCTNWSRDRVRDGAVSTCSTDGNAVFADSANRRSLSLRVAARGLDVPCNGTKSGPAMEPICQVAEPSTIHGPI